MTNPAQVQTVIKKCGKTISNGCINSIIDLSRSYR